MQKFCISILLTILCVTISAQNICDIDINPVCSSETFNVQEPNSSYEGSIESCDGEFYPMENVVWYEMRVLEGDSFTFLIEMNLGDDYDFALWKNPSCENLGIPDRASFIHEPLFAITTTGLMLNEEDACEGLGEFAYNTPGVVRHLDVVPGDRLLLMIQRPPVTSSGYDFNIIFNGTGGNAILDCSIVGNVYPKCDTDGNGTESFVLADFLTDLQTEYPGSVYQFYASHTEAMVGNLANTINFPHNTTVVNSPENLFIRIEDADGTFNRVIQITLVVNPIPVLNTAVHVELCDDDFDGQYLYSLNNLPSSLIGNPSEYQFQYFQSLANAHSYQNPLSESQILNFSMNTLPHSIWVVATNSSGCNSFPVEVNFSQAPTISTNANSFGPIPFCEAETIDLTQFQTSASNDSNLIYSYFETMENAQGNINPIASVTNYTANGTGEIYLRLDHETLCSNFVEIKFKENPIPEFVDLPTQLEICENETEDLFLTSTQPGSTFTWTLNGNEIFVGEAFTISEIGTYTLKVESAQGCSSERVINVVRPPSPTITAMEFGPDYAIVNASPGAEGGILEYSLDEIFWQSNPKFSNLVLGKNYTVYVREAGCMKDSYDFVLIALPNFISPNGDGKNDRFSIRGMQSHPNATLKIFDRFGKIFVDTKFMGNYEWDGKYLGRTVPSGDYWYIIEIPSDGITKAQRYVGHISVRNQ